jgi:hypothetical protein
VSNPEERHYYCMRCGRENFDTAIEGVVGDYAFGGAMYCYWCREITGYTIEAVYAEKGLGCDSR